MASASEAQRRLALLDEIAALKAEKKALLARAEQTKFSGWRDRPVPFVEEVLGDQLWSRQKAILEAVQRHRRVVVSSCFASGKTWTAARIVTWWCATHPSAIAITTASVGRQVSGQLWGEIRKLWRKGVRLPGTMTPDPTGSLPGGLLPKAPEWTITPGENFALGFSTNDPNRFAGWHGGRVLIVLDEAEGIPEDMWDIMEGQLSTGDTAVLAIGNPDPEGMVGGFQRAASSALWHHITISAFDTPNLVGGRDDIAPYLITGRWVEERRVEWGEDHPLWITKVLGQFVQGSGAKLVIPLSWFERAVDRAGTWDVSEEPQAGLDVARFGSADSVIAIRKGPLLLHLERIHGAAGPEVGGWAIDRMRSHGCTAVNGDATGLGGPVLDFMRLTPGIRVYDIHAGSKPSIDVVKEVARKRDELWWGLRNRFENDNVVLSTDRVSRREIDRLKSEVTQIRYRYLIDSRIEVESKEAMAARGLPSPDGGDALCLAYLQRPSGRSNISMLLGART